MLIEKLVADFLCYEQTAQRQDIFARRGQQKEPY